MSFRCSWVRVVVCALVAFGAADRAFATGVPVGGFLPMVGIGLTDEFLNSDDANWDFFAHPSDIPGGTFLGSGGTPHYDIALLDTGAAVSLITTQADAAFGIDESQAGESDGWRGHNTITIGGATGFLQALISDPLGLYAGGLQDRAPGSPLTIPDAALTGQTNTSIITIPPESDLPNVLGLPFASQYATRIRNDQPQIFQHNGQTVRSPAIEFLPLGSGGMGITRRAPMQLNPGVSFTTPPFYFFEVNEDLEFHENPVQPTVISGGMFLNVNATNEGQSLGASEFFFDTGADVTVVSELNALNLGFDPVLDTPEFTVAIVGSGGTTINVPGFFVDQFTITALGGSVVLSNVPVVVLNVTNPADPGNVVPGIVGTNLLSGRNLVVDPDPSIGGGNPGPQLFISDPVTTDTNWQSTEPSAGWFNHPHWSANAPTVLKIANIRHFSGDNQEAVLGSGATAWEVNVSGATPTKQMTLRVQSGATLTTFAGLNIEPHGAVALQNGALDVQYVDIRGGRLSGHGSIATGSGDIPGQVENISGVVAPGTGVGVLSIEGRYSNAAAGTLHIELGGLTPGTQYDRLLVDGPVTLDGTLSISLVNLGGGTFVPGLGNVFSIITATEVGGEFSTLNLPTLSANKMWQVTYDDLAVLLKVTIPGDFDGDFIVDGADLDAWKAGFGTLYNGSDFQTWQQNLGMTLTPPGDFDGDFSVDGADLDVWRAGFGAHYNGSDFLTWQRNLGMGLGGVAAVPEPSVWALNAIAMLGIAWRRRTG